MAKKSDLEWLMSFTLTNYLWLNGYFLNFVCSFGEIILDIFKIFFVFYTAPEHCKLSIISYDSKNSYYLCW